MAIIYHSIHHHNTEHLAGAMATSTAATVLSLSDFFRNGRLDPRVQSQQDPASWDILGIGSGIYFGRHHKQIFRFVREAERLPKYCFVYSTAGIRSLGLIWNFPLVRALRRRQVIVLGQFCAAGWDTFGPLKLIGGIHRGRPTKRDFARASRFAQRMLDRYQQRTGAPQP